MVVFMDDEVVCRFRGNNTVMAKEKMDYMDVSPKQVVSAATACIPFLKTMTQTVHRWVRTCNVKQCL